MRCRATWCLSNNVGDALNAWIAHKITGDWPLFVPAAMGGVKRAMLVGSILNHAQEDTVVAGAGVARLAEGINPMAKILAVRGPLSRQVALASGAGCPDVYGDPAMLLPEWIRPAESKTHKLGLIPHYTDHARAMEWWGQAIQDGAVRLINVFAPVEEFVQQITSCEAVLSSSLHGLVVADAYRVPNEWVTIDKGMIGGDGTKYRDHALSVGYELRSPVLLNGMNPQRLLNLPKQRDLVWDTERSNALLRAVNEALHACS